jgi:hypothetical protein
LSAAKSGEGEKRKSFNAKHAKAATSTAALHHLARPSVIPVSKNKGAHPCIPDERSEDQESIDSFIRQRMTSPIISKKQKSRKPKFAARLSNFVSGG